MTILTNIVEWERKLGIRRTVVLMVTLWMTYRAFDWAASYATIDHNGDALAAAQVEIATLKSSIESSKMFDISGYAGG